MKILFIINSLKKRSGIERIACHLANLFVVKLGHEVSIINRDTDHIDVAFDLNKKVKVICCIDEGYFLFYKKIQEYIESQNPNYIIVHNMGRLSLLCSLLKLGKNQKIFSLEHVAFNSRSKWIQLLSRLCYYRFNTIITLTLQDRLNYQNWVKKVITIYNVSPFPITTSLSREKKIIAVGRLTYQKNFQALLKAWEMIQSNIGNWKLEIYGVGEQHQDLKSLILNRKLRNVQLMGQSADMEYVYKSASIFVMSSRFEGLPMVLIEAQTFGLPIIAFDCPHGPAEIIRHNLNGLLVENQNIQSLSSAILDLINDQKKMKEFSDQALLDSRKFQEDKILSLWEDVII